MKLTQLKPDTRNANRGTKRGRALIERSLKDYGAGRSILLDRDGNIIAGNKTVESAKAAGLSDVQIVKSDGSRIIAVQRTDLHIDDPKARQLAIADNRASELSLEWDPEVLKQFGTEIDLSPFFNEKELVQFFAAADGGDIPAPKATEAQSLQRKWQTERGQIWEIPSATTHHQSHRLLCGDSTSNADVAKLFRGDRAKLYATDPPYLVDYTGADRPGRENRSGGKDWSDTYHEVQITDAEGFFRGVFSAASTVLAEDAAWYCWHAHKRAAMIEKVWSELGVLNHQQIVWVKPVAVHGFSFYPYQHEPCLMGWKKGHKPAHDGDNSHDVTTVWSCDWEGACRPKDNKHPTEKPIEIFARPIRKHTRPGDIVFESFSGSGTQLAAAEKLGRVCYAIEIEPAFVAVALERMSEMGLKPQVSSE